MHVQGFRGRADDGAGVLRLAAEFNGWRSRRQQWLQDDDGSSGIRGEPFLKATCDRLAFFDQHGVFDGRWPVRHFSSDSPSLAVDII